jgi:hypothetical protein
VGGAGAVTQQVTKETIQIPNVFIVDHKMKSIERLITVKPQDVRLA